MPPFHSYHYAASHRVAWSVSPSVTLVSPGKNGWKRSSCHLHSGLGWAQWTTYYMTSRGQHGKGQTRLNRSIWRFLVVDSSGQRTHKFNRICLVVPMCLHGRTCCRHLSNNIEPSVYGGDAPYVKLLWPHVIFGQAHLDSGTDSQALGADSTEYCIVGIPHNTAI